MCYSDFKEKSELKYYVGFSLVPQIGAKRGQKLVNFFDTLENAWKAGESDLARAGMEESVIDEILRTRSSIDLDKEMEKIGKEGIKLLTIKDEEYPKNLKEIYSPPFLLYMRGEIKNEDEYAVAVVGSRKCSDYGRQVTEQLCTELARNNITIISGLASGIDSYAHQSVVSTKEGRTIAVMGCGIDNNTIYPASNRSLAQRIITGRGAIISEYPVATPPLKQHFPARNRIISGLSLGVLVVEASEVSGALITAKYALEQGRDVFAIPGSLYNKNAVGPNSLIKMGAKLVEKAEDILEELNIKNVSEKLEIKEIVPENKQEKEVLKHLELEPIHIDELARLTKINISELNSLLMTMEMKGIIRNVGSGQYSKAKR